MFFDQIRVIFKTVRVFLFHRKPLDVEANQERRASEVAHMLQDEEWCQLRRQFSPLLRFILTESILRKGFAALKVTAGPIINIGRPKLSQGWLTTSAQIPIEFKRTKLGMSILLTPSGSLLGLHFHPQHALGIGHLWRAPTYAAASSSIRESGLRVGPPGLRRQGLLTLPAGTERYPCVVMLSGSGPCDLDSSVGSSKPFKDIALGLAAHGIATIRFDKVTKTYGKKVQAKESFTLNDEYIPHTIDALRQAFEHESVSRDSVFVLGHSLGAVVAPHLMAADPRIAGCIIMAGPATPPGTSMMRQLRYLASLSEPGDNTNPSSELDALQRQCDLSTMPDLALDTPRSGLPFGIGPAYWRSYADFRPIETCRDDGRPVLVLQGGRDYQVTVKDDFARWREALADESHVRMKVFESLNHLFISGQGQPSSKEYDDPGNVDIEVIQAINKWIVEESEDKSA